MVADDMTVSVENLKESTKKTTGSKSSYTKVAGYQVITQKSTAFLFTSNKQLDFKIKNPMLLVLAHPKNLSVNYNKNM